MVATGVPAVAVVVEATIVVGTAEAVVLPVGSGAPGTIMKITVSVTARVQATEAVPTAVADANAKGLVPVMVPAGPAVCRAAVTEAVAAPIGG